MKSPLLRTPLFDWHQARGARIVDFAGWDMPVQYSSIIEEHRATRRSCGVFDVSHMGRFEFRGEASALALDRLTTRRVADMPLGKIRYSLVCREDGGILDDVLAYRLADETGEYFSLVVNAGNRQKIAAWIESNLPPGGGVTFIDRTLETAMIAVQGPRAIEIVDPLVAVELAALEYYTGVVTSIGESEGVVSRTGYTGEDGCELIVPAGDAVTIVERLFERGDKHGIQPAGLGARDTLRLEAAMPLYGHELSEEIDPIRAGLSFALNLTGREFIGKAALERLKADPDRPRRVGLELFGRRVPREHFAIFRGDEPVGEITSGTFSPTLEKPIAMGYVHASAAALGEELAVDLRGRHEPARVVKLPFFSRAPN